MLDRYGNPIKEMYPMTRDLITDFAERFEAARYSAHRSRDINLLLDELITYEPVNNYIHIVEKDGCYGVFHELLGTLLVPTIYDELIPVGIDDERLYIARRSGKYSIVKADIMGTELLPFAYDRIAPLGEFLDLFVFEQAGHQGIIASCYGRFFELHPAIYDSVSHYPDTPFVLLSKEGKKGLWGASLSIPTLYDEVYVPYFFGWIKVKHQGQWGYIDHHGHFTDDIGKAFLYHDANRFYYDPELEK